MQGGIIALDINSTRTGVAFGDADALAPQFASWKMPGGADLPRACGELQASLRALIGIVHPRIVAIEAPLQKIDREHGARPAFVLMSLYGAAAGEAHQHQKWVIDGHVGQVRSYFIGSAHFKTDEAAKRIKTHCERLGWGIANHDEGDAAALWAWTMAKVNKRWAPNGHVYFGKCTGVISA